MSSIKQAQLDAERQTQLAARAMQQANAALTAASNLTAATVAATPAKPLKLDFDIWGGSFHHVLLPNGVNEYTCKINAKSLIGSLSDTWNYSNARDAIFKKNAVQNSIADTAVNTPADMTMLNNGLTVTALSVINDPVTGKVRVVLQDKQLHGILNGGHTRMQLQRIVESKTADNTLASWDCYVSVKILVGLTTVEAVSRVCDAVNNVVAMPSVNVAQQRGEYDVFKEVMKNVPYFSKINFKGKGNITMQKITTLLMLLNKDEFKGRESKGRIDFSSTAVGKSTISTLLTEQFRVNFQDTQPDGKVKHNNSMKMLFLHAEMILKLRDQIAIHMFEKCPKSIKMIEKKGPEIAGKKSTPMKYYYTQQKNADGTTETVPRMLKGLDDEAWINPMLNGFRANVIWDAQNETIDWIVPPSKLMKAAMPEMLERLNEIHASWNYDKSPIVRKTSALPDMYDICEQHVNEILASQP